ncbi:MAG: hypothetical protein F6K17_32250 [Okeania sp. SIO3C4]|nr:hypothetical protein [Okeania sp. SIO3B3]NER06923.1 hypothetical protein [Okeania sp. SIO3C4]
MKITSSASSNLHTNIYTNPQILGAKIAIALLFTFRIETVKQSPFINIGLDQNYDQDFKDFSYQYEA